MRLSGVLSKEPEINSIAVDDFASNTNVIKGSSRKINVGQIHLSLKCNECNSIEIFSSDEELSFIAVDKNKISIDAKLTCACCGKVTIPYWFLVAVEGVEEKTRSFSYPHNPKVRLIYKHAKWDKHAEPYPYTYKKEYSDLLIKADLAYNEQLGAGSLVYLRRLYEQVVDDIAKEHNISLLTNQGKPIKNFKLKVDKVIAVYNFIPNQLIDTAYPIFKQMSKVVHYEESEEYGLERYSTLKKLIIGILDEEKLKKARDNNIIGFNNTTQEMTNLSPEWLNNNGGQT